MRYGKYQQAQMKRAERSRRNARRLLRAFCLNRQTAPLSAGIEAGLSEFETREAWRKLYGRGLIEPYHGRVWVITAAGERACALSKRGS